MKNDEDHFILWFFTQYLKGYTQVQEALSISGSKRRTARYLEGNDPFKLLRALW